MSAIDMSAALAAFFVEGRELAQELEQGLMRLEQGRASTTDRELVNALFRAAHTIKGSAGIVGVESLGRFTHHAETVLDRVREGELPLDDSLIGVLLRSCDHIVQLLDLAESGDLQGNGLAHQETALLAQLAHAANGVGVTQGASLPPASSPPSSADEGFRLWAVFGRDSLRYGIDPASALIFMGEQARLETPVLLQQRVPSLDSLDPEDCWVALALRASQGTVQQAQEALEFCGDGTLIALCGVKADAAEVNRLLLPIRQALGDDALAPWLAAGLISDSEWSGVPAPAAVVAQALPAHAPVAEPLTDAERRPPVQDAPGFGAAGAVQRFVRVPADRLDQLNQQVGELVIAGATADELARGTRNPRLLEALSHLGQLIDSIQGSALQLRMVPIGETFNRFQRVVRDVSRELGKSISLEIVGGDTELDKAMVERIADPLMHLVRNAMDHGLETAAARAAAGKPETGTLRLRAFHDAGSVVVEVSDDGRGLDAERIRAKALAKGLISAGETLGDHEVHQLIFEPGFSTAEQVTALSGRGVGMDVVKSSVESLRGVITLHSKPGQGTLFQMRLPLTLAIIDGFMVRVDNARYILPLDLVVECIELPPDALMPDAPRYLNLRGEVLPYVSLREAFAKSGTAPERPSVVVVRSGDRKAGVLVDQLLGEIQTVIKPMSRIFRHLRVVCGTSILGSGDIALILDVHQLVQRCVDHSSRAAVVLPDTH